MERLQRSNRLLENYELSGFFWDYYSKVRKALSNDQFNQFCKLATDEDKVRFVYQMAAAHDIDIKSYFRGKSEKEALERKEAGNKAFGRKNNLEALKLYSQAVVKAPVPSGKYWKLIKENTDPKKMTLYSICLANRSAALYHMKEFYYCVKDMNEALEHHYPKELKYKLYKRKARILVDLKRYEDARDGYRQAIKWLDWARMESEKRLKIQKELQRWLKIFESGKVVQNAELTEPNLYPPVPELTGGSNEAFPSLTKKAQVLYEKNQGRFIVAKEDIAPGDVICTEKPYASVLISEAYGSHCQRCFLLTKAPIPCKLCSGVIFCSAECRDASYFHRIECPILELLRASGMSVNCFLALRMLTQMPLSCFLEMKDRLLEDDPQEIVDNKTVYDPNDFLRVYNCVRHSEKRTPEDYFHRTVMAIFMLKALKKTRYFEDKSSSVVAALLRGFQNEKMSDPEAFVGGLLLRFMQIVQFNAHEVSEFVQIAPKTIDSAKNETIGAAVFPTLALSNHSCHSSQVRYFSGNQVITKAVRPIRKGELIPENYGPCFTAKSRSDRRQELIDRYWFECSCEACQKDWPMYKDMDNSVLNFKCQACSAPIPVRVDTVVPFFECGTCKKQTNILSALKNLQNSEQTFQAACSEMRKYDLVRAAQLLTENMSQLNASLYPPYRDYHLTQEAFMRVCLCQGNLRVRVDDNDIKKN